MSPRQYLAETAQGGAGVRGFMATLTGLGPEVTVAEARASSAALRRDADMVSLAYQHLSAGRLSDSRLERQRTRATAALARVTAALSQISAASADGRPDLMVSHLPELRAAVADLRSATG